MPEKNKERASGQVWHRVNGLSAFALIYLSIETLISFIGSKFVLPWVFPGLSSSQLDARYGDSLTFFAVLVAFLFAVISQRKAIFGFQTSDEEKVQWLTGCKPGVFVLVIALTLCFLAQLVALAAQTGLEGLVAAGGLQMPRQGGDTSDPNTSVIMLFYAFLFGPLAEEVVFRGVFMNGLRPYGRVFAIISSAFLFGWMHGSLAQGLFGFLTGLVLGYVAMEYGLVWSLFLHIFNNGVYTGILPRIMQDVPEVVRIGVGAFIMIVLLAGLIGLVLKIKPLVHYCRNNKAPRGIYASWLSPWFLVFVLLCLGMALAELIPA